MTLSESVIRSFVPDITDYTVESLGSGLIHKTLLVESGSHNYVFQGLNSHVFPDLDQVMENIEKVTGFLRSRGEPTLTFLQAGNGRPLMIDENEVAWRCSELVPDTVTYDTPPSPAHLKNAARAFAGFGKALSTANLSLHPTIEGFHDTPQRFQKMEAAWKAAPQDRQSVADYYAIRHAGSGFPEFGLDGLLAPHVPQAVSHNDTKLNNCLFREGSQEVICVIDLDTVMEGSWLLDFGDLCRTAICSSPEDTDDLDSITVDLDRFRALVEGYAEVLGDSISQAEKERMVYSVFLLTYELALRFFTDHLQEDKYFGASFPEHNLVRARSQLTLALQVLNQREAMEKIVAESFP